METHIQIQETSFPLYLFSSLWFILLKLIEGLRPIKLGENLQYSWNLNIGLHKTLHYISVQLTRTTIRRVEEEGNNKEVGLEQGRIRGEGEAWCPGIFWVYGYVTNLHTNLHALIIQQRRGAWRMWTSRKGRATAHVRIFWTGEMAKEEGKSSLFKSHRSDHWSALTLVHKILQIYPTFGLNPTVWFFIALTHFIAN